MGIPGKGIVNVSDPPLLVMSRDTPTRLWNDSADPAELAAALEWGAVGATCNPVIALTTLERSRATWAPRVRALATEWPTATESQLGWEMVKRLSVESAQLLLPVFQRTGGRDGRLSIQTDPRLYRDTEAIVRQAVEFHALAPNVIVKVPVTSEALGAFEELTFRGVSINATVSFTVAQALAVGAAVERGLTRREEAGLDISAMGPVCTIMVGRLDDWLRVVAEREQITVDPGILEWAGVAVFKRAYALYRERGYRTRLLSAAFRNHMHWSELVGGDVVISPPFAWQQRFNSSGISPEPRLERPVDERILGPLQAHFVEFAKAYEPDGLAVDQFTGYGATRRTLRQFLAATSDLEAFARDVLLPDPG